MHYWRTWHHDAAKYWRKYVLINSQWTKLKNLSFVLRFAIKRIFLKKSIEMCWGLVWKGGFTFHQSICSIIHPVMSFNIPQDVETRINAGWNVAEISSMISCNLIHDKLPILVLLWVSMDKVSPVLLPHFGGHTEHWVVWIRSWKANCQKVLASPPWDICTSCHPYLGWYGKGSIKNPLSKKKVSIRWWGSYL
jgi:hypothetical protein